MHITITWKRQYFITLCKNIRRNSYVCKARCIANKFQFSQILSHHIKYINYNINKKTSCSYTYLKTKNFLLKFNLQFWPLNFKSIHESVIYEWIFSSCKNGVISANFRIVQVSNTWKTFWDRNGSLSCLCGPHTILSLKIKFQIVCDFTERC